MPQVYRAFQLRFNLKILALIGHHGVMHRPHSHLTIMLEETLPPKKDKYVKAKDNRKKSVEEVGEPLSE